MNTEKIIVKITFNGRNKEIVNTDEKNKEINIISFDIENEYNNVVK